MNLTSTSVIRRYFYSDDYDDDDDIATISFLLPIIS